MCTVPVARRFCRESYNEPEAVYERLKQLGMDLVTITDHDSVGAAESLRRHDDFFLSEEATCTLPNGTEIHVGIYDITERQHTEIERRRADFLELVAWLREQQLFYSINHVFSSLTGHRELEDYAWFASMFPAAEVLNGAMPAVANREAARWARRSALAPIGGSDAHAMASVGAAWTSVPGARTRAEFFASLRAGRAEVNGRSGSWAGLTADVLTICRRMMAETPWTALLAPAVAGVPAVTAIHWIREAVFARTWARRTQSPHLSCTESVQPAAEVTA